MNIETERRDRCKAAKCGFVYLCKVHWGEKCNRQGGQRIPRMKSMPPQYFEEPVSKQEVLPVMRKGILGQVLETIKTRAVGW